MHVWYLPILDDVRGEHIDDQYHDEDECLHVEGFCTHFFEYTRGVK